MIKFIILFLIFTLFGFCEPIKFKEEKFISSLQTSVYRDGLMNISNNSIEIKYPNEKKSFIFTDGNIIEKNANEEKILTYDENLELTIFSKIIRSIYQDKTDELKEYFEIRDEDKKIILLPNEYISNVINKIEYKKNNSKLEFLKIYFTNEDWINIIESK